MRTKDFKKLFKGSFFKFMFTYSIYIFILLIMLILFCTNTVKYWEARELSIYENELEKKITVFKEQLRLIESTVLRIEDDIKYRSLSTLNFIPDNNYYVTAHQIQKDYTLSVMPLTLVSDSGVVYGNDFVITRNRVFPNNGNSLQSYSEYFSVKGYTNDEWLNMLRNIKRYTLFPRQTVESYDYGTYDAIIYTVPILDSASRYGSFYATIKQSTLVELFLSNSIINDAYLYISDIDNNVYINHNFSPKSIQESKFYQIEKKDLSTGLIYHIGIPKNYLTLLMKPLFSSVIIYIILLVAGGLIIAMLFSHKSTKPVRNLVNVAHSLNDNHVDINDSNNEYEYIEGIINGLNNSLNITQAQLINQKREAKRLLLDKAIHGHINNSDQLSYLIELFPELPEKYQLVFIIREELSTNIDAQLSAQLLIQHALDIFYTQEITALSILNDSVLYILPRGVKDIEEHCTKLSEFLSSEYNIKARIFVSKPYSDVFDMPSAYTDTLYSIQEMGNLNTEKTGYSEDDFGLVIKRLPIDFTSFQQFYEAISNGDKEITTTLLGRMQNSMRTLKNRQTDLDAGISEIIYQSLYKNLLSNLCTILLQVKLNHFQLLSGTHIPNINSYVDMDAFFEDIIICSKEICNTLNSQQSYMKQNKRDNMIIDFTNDHIFDINLCATMLADEFDISENTLQKIFRKTTGKTFYEYVESIRLNNVYHLLKNSQKSISEIAEISGFSSYNSMYKAFKRRYNISPSAVAKKTL